MKISYTLGRTLFLITGLLSSGALGSCASWPGFEDPVVTLAPKISLFRVRGTTQMAQNNVAQQPQTIRDLGMGARDEELAARLSYGDGFSGFDIDYLLVRMESTTEGRASQNWGSIRQGETVNSGLTMDEIRLRYIGQLPWDYLSEDEATWFKAGIGLQLAHRELSFRVNEVNGSGSINNSQSIEIKDDLSPMLAVRLAGGRGPVNLQVDYAVNDDWGIGTGDFEKRFFDLSIQLNYYLEAQDLTLFGGYRRFDIRARGTEGSSEYRTDFSFDGLYFGFRFLF